MLISAVPTALRSFESKIMDTLEQYLTGAFTSDAQDIAQIERLAKEVSATLCTTYDDAKGWAYQFTREGAGHSTDLSQSTTTMVALALGRLAGTSGRASTVSSVPYFPAIPLGKQREAIVERVSAGCELLLNALTDGAEVKTFSTTYGSDDPFTLSFLAELVRQAPLATDDKWERVRSYVSDRASKLCSVNPIKQESFYKDCKHKVVENAIIPLRAVRAARMANPSEPLDAPDFRAYFETRLHDQLSFSSIPDSRFDPAELTFCLEGLLLCQEDIVDATVFGRVVEVLSKAQHESAFWRPTKPFLATMQGMSLFPVSVEVANSLLRSCEIYDGGRLYDTFGSSAIGLFRRYWQWVRARAVRFRHQRAMLVGWHSEHVNDLNVIHVWETSQILEFLLGYRRILQTHMARTTLIRSRFSYKDPEEGSDWSGVVSRYEPTSTLGNGYQVYKRIGNDFVDGWLSGNPKNFSMLLYGPPGTGKTTIAENLANALSFRRITITVSDFLAGGSAEIEARAKSIFDVLLAQSDCVVLFDEIDNLLLDRDSKRYDRQESVFQFMTPGMLTKLNDLRRSQRVIFVIATNYENRIDSAIKRPGRIDERYLVLPPDGPARRRILEELLLEAKSGPKVAEEQLSADIWTLLVKNSLFLGFKDIEGAVKSVEVSGVVDVAELGRALDGRARTTSLASYGPRFASISEATSTSEATSVSEEPPVEEFLCLLAMAEEVDRFVPADLAAVSTAAKALRARGGTYPILDIVRQRAPGLTEDKVEQVAKRLGGR